MLKSRHAGRIGVWGRSGSGKSTYVKKRIKGQGRVVVFDPLGEYQAEGFKLVSTLEGLRCAVRDNWQGFRIAYMPPAAREAAALSALSRLLMRAQEPYRETGRGPSMILVVEELNMSFPTLGVSKCAGFAEICSRGRHYGIEVIGTSQRIAEVATRFRGNCTETVALVQKGPRDLRAAADELGCDISQVQALKPFHYLHEKSGEITAGKV